MPTVQDNDPSVYDASDVSSVSSYEDADEDEISDEEKQPYIAKSSSSYATIIWTGSQKQIPIMIFHADAIVSQPADVKDVGEKFHLAYKMIKTECKLVRSILVSHGFRETSSNSNDFNLMWTGSHVKPYVLRTFLEFQKINHFPRSYEVTRKDRLFKNIQRMQQTKGFRHFDFVPQSFLIPTEYQEFCASAFKDRGPWIVKPAASSRGRGIFLISSPDQLPLEDSVVVCRYIANPLLIDGFKFDVRLYVAVTSFDPLLIYLYEEGLTRFATVKFDKSFRTLRNQCMHLTNYSVNKKNTDYVANDDPDVEDYGNKWSLGAMLRYLCSQGIDTTALMMSIEDVIIKTLISVELPIATACKMFMPYSGNCFELFGFDILIDENLRPWVLEVNLSPSLACDAPIDLKIKSNMIADLFSLVGFTCQDPVKRKVPFDGSWNVRSRPSARAQSAKQRPKSSLLYRRKRPESASLAAKLRPAVGSGIATSGNLTLSGEEMRVIRRAREEHSRRGGWVRIFPSVNSWDMYSSFLQYTTTYNNILYHNLYPSSKAKQEQMTVSVHLRHKALNLHSLPNSQLTAGLQNNIVLTHAVERCKQYQRKLACLGQKPGHRLRSQSGTKKSTETRKTGAVVQGTVNDLTPPGKDGQSTQDTVKSGAAAEKALDVESDLEHKASSHPSPEKGQKAAKPRYDVLQLLQEGKTLSKVQARFAFATYLTCIQQRLIAETRGEVDTDVETANEQMDLVLRFLQRAASNLQQEFRVIIPSSHLPINSRRTMLAAQLRDFVHIYNAETKHLKKRLKLSKAVTNPDDTAGSNCLDDEKFKEFVLTAGENKLEEVLTVYTRLSQSASVFLRSTTHGTPSQSSSSIAAAMPIPHLRYRHDSDKGTTKESVVEISGKASAAEKQVENTRSNPGNIPLLRSNAPSRSSSQHSSSSYHGAVAAYSAKLASGPRQRPMSGASQKSLAQTGGSRPMSVGKSSASGSHISSQTECQPEPKSSPEIEEDVHAALERLVTRQRHRQYSASKARNLLSHESVQVDVHDASGEHSDEEYVPNPRNCEHSSSAFSESAESRPSISATTVSSLAMAGDAQSGVLNGGKNANYYECQKSMIEQSRALLEQSKAKHHALVAQAHTMQKRLRSVSATYAAGDASDMGYQHSAPMAPKPPALPHGDRKPVSFRTQRLARAVSSRTDDSGGNGDFDVTDVDQDFI